MKALLTKKSIFIASIAIVIAISTIVSLNVFGNSGMFTRTANSLSNPLREAAMAVTRVFEGLYNSIYRYDALFERYEELHMQLAELRADAREAAELRVENDRLRDAFDFYLRHERPDLTYAEIIDRTSSNFMSSFLINRGYENSQIRSGDSIITGSGMLIGRVTTVDARTSTVITILDTTFSAGVYIGEGGGATAMGDFSLMGTGYLILDHFPDATPVAPGDDVVTSGIGGVFPSGLVVGEVVSVRDHSTGIGRYAVVRPMLPLEDIAHVFIYHQF